MTAKTRRSVGEGGSTRRRPPDEPLSRDRIVGAALALVDHEGLALCMRRLAAALGVDPMAIYYYLPNKAALEDAIVEAVNVEMPVGFACRLPWTIWWWGRAGSWGRPCCVTPMPSLCWRRGRWLRPPLADPATRCSAAY